MDKLARVESHSLAAQADVVAELPAIFQLAGKLMQARGFIPQHLKNEGEVAAAIIAGRELGLPPMTALRSIYLVNGKVALAGIRHEWISDGSDGKVARLKLERPGDRPYIAQFTIDEAERAGLLKNPTWRSYAPAMLRARCVSTAGRAYCPDILSGIYVPEELDSFTGSNTQAIEASIAHEAPDFVNTVTGELVSETQADPVGSLLVDLPNCGTRESLVMWAKELTAIKANSAAKKPAWDLWAARCAERELSPQELAAEARGKAA
jgi:hypothetical protein